MSDIEKSVIDSCLSDKKNLYRVVDELQVEDFDSAVCQKAFVAISSLVNDGLPVTPETLSDYDKSIPKDLFFASSVNGENLDYYIPKLKDQGKAKKLKKILLQCQDVIQRPEINADESIQLIQDIVLGTFDDHKKSDTSAKIIGDAVLKIYEEKKKSREAGGEIISLPTGISRLDAVIGGFQPGTLIVYAARQGHGKSTTAMDFSFKASKEGHPTLYLTLEQTSTEIFLYHLQKHTGFRPLDIKQGNLCPGDELVLKEAVRIFRERPLFINHQARTLSDVVATIRMHHLTKGIELVIIDYLQLIENSRKNEPRHIEVAGISRTLKQLAIQLNISIVALSQLNKSPEERTSKRIYLSDTRESEAITQDADAVIFLYRPSIYGDDERDYISLAKNRNGPIIDKIYLRYNFQFNRYEEIKECRQK